MSKLTVKGKINSYIFSYIKNDPTTWNTESKCDMVFNSNTASEESPMNITNIESIEADRSHSLTFTNYSSLKAIELKSFGKLKLINVCKENYTPKIYVGIYGNLEIVGGKINFDDFALDSGARFSHVNNEGKKFAIKMPEKAPELLVKTKITKTFEPINLGKVCAKLVEIGKLFSLENFEFPVEGFKELNCFTELKSLFNFLLREREVFTNSIEHNANKYFFHSNRVCQKFQPHDKVIPTNIVAHIASFLKPSDIIKDEETKLSGSNSYNYDEN